MDLLNETYRISLKEEIKSLSKTVLNSDSKSYCFENLKILQKIFEEIKNKYLDLFYKFNQSSVKIKYNNKEDIIYNDDLIFNKYIIHHIYKLGDKIYIKIIDVYDDFLSEDVDLDLILALIDNYPEALEYSKYKYIDLLNSRIYNYETKIKQFKQRIIETKDELKKYENNL